MDTLPDDVLIEIFHYLDVKSKLTVTRVCKRFNDIISNNSVLMRNIQLNLKFFIINRRENVIKRARLNFIQLLYSNRKYQNLRIIHLDDSTFHLHGDQILEYLCGHAKNLKFFEILLCRLTYENLWKILNSLPELQEISYVDFNVNGSNNSLIEMPMSSIIEWPKLKILKSIDGSNNCFQFLSSSKNLKEIYINKWSKSFDQFFFENFLCIQENLKYLEIKINDSLGPKLFSSNIRKIFKFQLETLNLYGIQCDDDLIEFLENQKCIENFILKQCTLSNTSRFEQLFRYLLKLQHLTNIQLHIFEEVLIQNYSIFLLKNHNIKSFTFTMENHLQDFSPLIEGFSNSMPNLQTLNISKIHSTLSLEDVIFLNNFKHLENLTLTNCKMEIVKVIRIESLKHLRIQFESKCQKETFTSQTIADWIQFLQCHKNIIHLKLDYIHPNEGLLLLLGNILLNLKHLEIWIKNLNAIKTILGHFKILETAEFRIISNSLRIDAESPLYQAGYSIQYLTDGLKIKRSSC